MTPGDAKQFVISGPGGAGKGTVVEQLLARDDQLWLSRSWTTRQRRDKEPEDAYVFVSRDAFMDRVEAGGFLEWVEFLDYLQGTPLPEPPPGADVVFEIDIVGAAALCSADPQIVSIFIDTPSIAVQRERLIKRGDSDETVQRRLEKGLEERQAAAELGSTVVVNDSLDETVRTVEAIIRRTRHS